MGETIPVAQTIKIRDCRFDEFWLRDRIKARPSCLGLGDLEVVDVERRQSRGGRLDLLLKDPEDDSMYEVELMLGETDESHIVRTIEYWDNERRRWPQREHHAVLVAESFSRRFFNVVHLLGQTIPLIAIQASVLECGGHRALHFSKVLDVYVEPEDITPPLELVDEAYWRQLAPATLDTATDFLEVVRPALLDAALKFTPGYIAITAGLSNNNYFYIQKRAAGQSRLSFRVSVENRKNAAAALEEAGLSNSMARGHLGTTINRETVSTHAETFRNLAALVKQYWES